MIDAHERPTHLRAYGLAALLGLGLSALLWLAAAWLQIGAPTLTSRWFGDILRIKTARATSVAGPKIVVVGGSSVHFSVKAAEIERALGVPAVNMGSSAALGLPYVLHTGARVARPGDLLVLSIEYELYGDDGRPNDQLIDYVLAHDPDYLAGAPLADRLRFLFGPSPRRLVGGLASRAWPGSVAGVGATYLATTVDAYGDETHNRDEDAGPIERARLAAWLARDESIEGISPDGGACQAIADFVARARGDGADVVALWPNRARVPSFDSPGSQRTIAAIRSCYARAGAPILGQPADGQYDRALFYDTGHHMTDRGARLNTARVVDLIAPHRPGATAPPARTTIVAERPDEMAEARP
jgi:hypothetical protein